MISKYLLTGLIQVTLNFALLFIFSDMIGLSAGLVSIPIMGGLFLMRYFILRDWVFKKKLTHRCVECGGRT